MKKQQISKVGLIAGMVIGALFFTGCQEQTEGVAFDNANDERFFQQLDEAGLSQELVPRDVQYSVEEQTIISDFIATLDEDDGLNVEDEAARRAYFNIFLFRFSVFLTGVGHDLRYDRVTAFAPTNEAFINDLGIANLFQVIRHPRGLLRSVIQYHIVEGRFKADQLSTRFFPTVLGPAVNVAVSREGITVNETNVVAADRRDFQLRKGVLHVIDGILLPPTANIVELAVSFNPDQFNLLVQAVVRAELVDVLSSEGPFTVFAPTDDAFTSLLDALDFETIDDVPVDLLTNVLLYHVITPARVFSTDLAPGSVMTALGQDLEIIGNGGSFVLDDLGTDVDANLLLTDVQATNGVVHVINKVLVPDLSAL